MDPKYSVGDKIKLNDGDDVQRVIVSIYSEFYNESGISKETYYETKKVNDDTTSICPLPESSIDHFYTKSK